MLDGAVAAGMLCAAAWRGPERGEDPLRSQTAMFSRLVSEFMGERPVTVRSGTSCQEVVSLMTLANASSVIINDAFGRPIGLVTERDVSRRMTFQVSPDTAVDTVMTRPVMTVPVGEYLYQAIGRMRQHGLHHLPVVSDGRVVGSLSLDLALTAASEQMVQQVDRITHNDTMEGMNTAREAQWELADELLRDGLPAPDIQGLLTSINNDIYRRIVGVCVQDLEMEGWGAPPVDFVVIVLGSSGRGENSLFPDQDNGFILDDYPDEEHNRIDGYFRELAERMVTFLAAVGLPLCKGYCMAINPTWRKTQSQWRDQVDGWRRRRSLVATQMSDIFFDFQLVWGRKRELAMDVRSHVTGMAMTNPGYLRSMCEAIADHRTASGMFGRFITERESTDNKGKINLKHNGLLPLVQSARILALREGIEETSTLARIDALQAREVLEASEQERLKEAFAHIATLLLRQQIADFKAGLPVGNYLPPQGLSRRERDRLRESFRAIEDLRRRMAREFHVTRL
ncbi:MAG: putative nucleotidyltransferase substrate binding domain-containing protein [Alphaproteobacteria bacterium]